MRIRAESEKDRIARQTADLRVTFEMALSNKRKYPIAEFKAFVQSARHYIEITADDPNRSRKSLAEQHQRLVHHLSCVNTLSFVLAGPAFPMTRWS